MRWFALLIVILLSGMLLALSLPDGASEVQSQVEGLPSNSAGFERAQPGRSFSFPLDHGPHEEYQTEWWYYTGNLSSADGRKFGYQLTFFRRAMTPVEQRQERQSKWAADQVYLAHFTLTDVMDASFRLLKSWGGVGWISRRDWTTQLPGLDRSLVCRTDWSGPVSHARLRWRCVSRSNPVRSQRTCPAGRGWLQPERSRSRQCLLLLQPEPPGITRTGSHTRHDL
jgi:hypothetical protein